MKDSIFAPCKAVNVFMIIKYLLIIFWSMCAMSEYVCFTWLFKFSFQRIELLLLFLLLIDFSVGEGDNLCPQSRRDKPQVSKITNMLGLCFFFFFTYKRGSEKGGRGLNKS